AVYSALRIPPVSFAPWTAGFEERVSALSKRTRCIVYFYPVPDTTTFRYRVVNMINASAASPDCETSASWFCGGELSRMDRMLERADALVICRAPYTPGVDQLIAKGRARRIPVFFDIDDLVFDPMYARGVMGIMNLDAT